MAFRHSPETDPVSEELFEMVYKDIYTSCDPDNSNQVPTSKLIDFIRPFVVKHPSALESLKGSIDPDDKNVCISYQTFVQHISVWVKDIADLHEGNVPLGHETLCSSEEGSPSIPSTCRTPNVLTMCNTTECDRGEYTENDYSKVLSDNTNVIGRTTDHRKKALNETKLLTTQVVVTKDQLEKSQVDWGSNPESESNLNNLLKENIIEMDPSDSLNSGLESQVQTPKRRSAPPIFNRGRGYSRHNSTSSVKQQSCTNTIEKQRTKKLNNSLPITFNDSTVLLDKSLCRVNSEDLDDSVRSVDEHQTMGYPQASLQTELVEVQGSTSRNYDENKSPMELKVERQGLRIECESCKRQKTDENRFNGEMKKEIDKLRQLCKSYEETIQSRLKSHLELENTVKQTDSNCNSEVNDHYKAKFSRMEREIDIKNKEISSLQDIVHKNKAIMNTMWTDLKKYKLVIEDLEQENQQMKKEYKGKCQSNQELPNGSEVNQQMTQFSQELPITDSQTEQINTKAAQIEECLEEITMQKTLIEKLRNEINQLKEMGRQFDVIKQNYEEQIYNQTCQLTETEKKLDVWRRNYEKQIARHAQQLREEGEQRKTMEKTYKEKIAHQAKQLKAETKQRNTIEMKYIEQIARKTDQVNREIQQREIIEQKYNDLIAHQADQLKKEAEQRNIIEMRYREQIAIKIDQINKEVQQRQNIEQKYNEQIACQAHQLKQEAKQHSILEQKYKEQIARKTDEVNREIQQRKIIEQQYNDLIAHQADQLKKEAEQHNISEMRYREQIAIKTDQINKEVQQRQNIEKKYNEQIACQAQQLKEEAKQHSIMEQKYKEQITRKTDEVNREIQQRKIIEQQYNELIAHQEDQLKKEVNQRNIIEQRYKKHIARQINSLKEEANQRHIMEQKYKEQIAHLTDQIRKEVDQRDLIEEKYKEEVARQAHQLKEAEVKLNASRELEITQMNQNTLLQAMIQELNSKLDFYETERKTNLENHRAIVNKLLGTVHKTRVELESQIHRNYELRCALSSTVAANSQLTGEIEHLSGAVDEKIAILERERSEKTSNETFMSNLLLEWSKMLQQEDVDEFPSLNLGAKLLKFGEMLSKVCMALQEATVVIADDDSSSTSSTKKSSTSSIPTGSDRATLTPDEVAQDETCIDTYEESVQINRNSSTLSLEFQFDEAFPLSCTFLNDLGIQDDNLIEASTLEERQELFNKITARISLEKTTERVKLCKQQCQSQYTRFHYLIKDISVRLRDHKCIGALAPVNPVFILLEDLRLLLQEIMQSSGHLGALMCEEATIQHWHFLKDYVESIETSHRRDLMDKKVGTDDMEVNLKNQMVGTSKDNKYRWYGCAGLIAIFALIFVYWQSQRSDGEPILPIEFLKNIENIDLPI